MQISATMRRHPRRTAIVGVVLVALVALGLWWFAPWNLVVDRTVDEALPGASEPGAGSQATEDEAASGGGTSASEGAAGAGAGPAPRAPPSGPPRRRPRAPAPPRRSGTT